MYKVVSISVGKHESQFQDLARLELVVAGATMLLPLASENQPESSMAYFGPCRSYAPLDEWDVYSRSDAGMSSKPISLLSAPTRRSVLMLPSRCFQKCREPAEWSVMPAVYCSMDLSSLYEKGYAACAWLTLVIFDLANGSAPSDSSSSYTRPSSV